MHNAAVALDSDISSRLKRNADGLVCAVVQQHDSREVLMVGWMDDEALRRTLTEGRVTFWSRSRGEYWLVVTSGPGPVSAPADPGGECPRAICNRGPQAVTMVRKGVLRERPQARSRR